MFRTPYEVSLRRYRKSPYFTCSWRHLLAYCICTSFTSEMSSSKNFVFFLLFGVKIEYIDLYIQISKIWKPIFIKVFCSIFFTIFPIFVKIDFIDQYFKTIHLLNYFWCSKPQVEASNNTNEYVRSLRLRLLTSQMNKFEASGWGF